MPKDAVLDRTILQLTDRDAVRFRDIIEAGCFITGGLGSGKSSPPPEPLRIRSFSRASEVWFSRSNLTKRLTGSNTRKKQAGLRTSSFLTPATASPSILLPTCGKAVEGPRRSLSLS